MAIPVTVIGGYLGAGKTTLVNHLLRRAEGVRLAVLVNEFGALPIDADLIEGRQGDVLSIAGGCICCSYGSDLMEALIALGKRAPAPDHVLIETSGVALPGAVAAAVSLIAAYVGDGIVVLADAETVCRHGRDRFLADTIARQLGDADLVLLNKADLADGGRLHETRAWLAERAPRARLITTAHARVPPGVLLGSGLGRPAIPGLASAHDATAYATAAIRAPARVDCARLAERLAEPSLGILRAKGFLAGPDGALLAFQLVGARASFLPGKAPAAHRGVLVVIGLTNALDLPAIERAVADCALPDQGRAPPA